MKRICPVCTREFDVTKKYPGKKTCGRSCGRLLSLKDENQQSLLEQSSIKNENKIRPHWVNPNARGVKGKRQDLDNLYVRSRWEANVARILNLLIDSGDVEKWEYEPKIFEFPVKKGNKWYTPDFKVFFPDETYLWIEVKGWMDNNSKVKIKRFNRYYPEEPFYLIDSKVYKLLEKEFSEKVSIWEKA